MVVGYCCFCHCTNQDTLMHDGNLYALPQWVFTIKIMVVPYRISLSFLLETVVFNIYYDIFAFTTMHGYVLYFC